MVPKEEARALGRVDRGVDSFKNECCKDFQYPAWGEGGDCPTGTGEQEK